MFPLYRCIISAHAAMSSCNGKKLQDANGQNRTCTDVLTAQFPWEQDHQHIPSPSISPGCFCKSLTSLSNATNLHIMCVHAFLVGLSHQIKLNLSCGVHVWCVCVCEYVDVYFFNLSREQGQRTGKEGCWCFYQTECFCVSSAEAT